MTLLVPAKSVNTLTTDLQTVNDYSTNHRMSYLPLSCPYMISPRVSFSDDQWVM